MCLDNKSILVTGGTGSFGQKFIETILLHHKPKELIVYSRDEQKQYELQKKVNKLIDDPSVFKCVLGDVRDKNRLNRIFNGMDIVIHAAAMKHIPFGEKNPYEAIMTNVIGTQNVIDAAIDNNVDKVIMLSTDKAVSPSSLYGSSKLCAERLIVHSNDYTSSSGTKFSCARYGNVMGSRGSVVPLFIEQRKTGKLTVTDTRMSRFWITLASAVEFVIKCIGLMSGGEVFVPKTPSMKLSDLIAAIAPDCEMEIIGPQPGEKLTEFLISQDEARNTKELEDMYVILPQVRGPTYEAWKDVKSVDDNFVYSSIENEEFLTIEDFHHLIEKEM